MRQDIVDKLNILLSKPMPIASEYEALYLMAQLRKLWEQNGKPKTPLSFWMNWALHTNLDHDNTVKDIMDECYGIYDKIVSGNRFSVELLKFENFRKHLYDFINNCGLPLSVCDDDDGWKSFLLYYCGVVHDCEAVRINPPKTSHVHRLVFRVNKRFLGDGSFPFEMEWHLSLTGCAHNSVILSAYPNGRFTSFGASFP